MMINRNATTDGDSLSSTFTGRVRCVNPKGLKLEGHDDWFNVSKFAVGVVLPERGQDVTVTVDKAGFLRAVIQTPGFPPPVAGASDAPNHAKSRHETPRDATITRLAVLKAAAEFGAARQGLKSGDVLAIAESWERWVLRSDDPTDDLAEAF